MAIRRRTGSAYPDHGRPNSGRQRLAKDREIVKETKNQKPRRVPLTDRAIEALNDTQRRIGINPPLIFPAAKGGVFDIHNWRARVWTAAVKKAQLAPRGPNALRHTFASDAIRRGLPTYQLARVMGTGVQMIDKHYGHLLTDADETILGYLSDDTAPEADPAADSL